MQRLWLQVYRGQLRSGGREVAVKVQRPLVRESIALDIHILRILAAFVRRWRRLNSDLPALLDEVMNDSTFCCELPLVLRPIPGDSHLHFLSFEQDQFGI